MIDYTRARAIADEHLADFWGYLEVPLLIHCVIPHRCGWEFRDNPAGIDAPDETSSDADDATKNVPSQPDRREPVSV